jgi:hypothetical protein
MNHDDLIRLWALENRVFHLPDLVDGLNLRARAAEEVQYVLWQLTGGGPPPSTFTLTVRDNGTLLPIAGAYGQIADSAGDAIQTQTTNSSGVATFTVVLADGTYTYGAYAAGYQQGSGSYGTLVVSGGGSYAGSCLLDPGTFQFPAYINRTIVDSLYGTFTLPYVSNAGGNAEWILSQVVDYAGGRVICPAVAGITIQYDLVAAHGGGNSLGVSYHSTGGTALCPGLGAVNRQIVPTVSVAVPTLQFTTGTSAIPLYPTTQVITIQ